MEVIRDRSWTVSVHKLSEQHFFKVHRPNFLWMCHVSSGFCEEHLHECGELLVPTPNWGGNVQTSSGAKFSVDVPVLQMLERPMSVHRLVPAAL